jgi:outer membrane protein OmpA-like peptidoglycan-associated protein
MSNTKCTTLFGLSLLASACAGSPPAALVDARAAYQRAAQGPADEHAPGQLHAAETFLKTAERTYEEEGDSPNARDRAYIAMRKAELAEAHAKIVESNIEVARAERRGESDQARAQAVATEELADTRAQLQRVRGVMEKTEAQLLDERERRQQAERAQQQALAALGNVKQDQRGTVITLSGSVIFSSGRSELLPSARSKLSEVAAALAQGDPGARIVVEGHTDSVGSAEKNQELSIERAESVRDELIARGVAAERVTVQGFGPSRPIADNGTPAGRANNRRVEIVVQPAADERASGAQRPGAQSPSSQRPTPRDTAAPNAGARDGDSPRSDTQRSGGPK